MQLPSWFPHDSAGLHYAVRIFLGTSIVWLVLLKVGDANPLWAVISVIVVAETQVSSAWQAFLSRIVSPSSIASRRKRPVFRHKSLFTNAGFVQSAVV
jgi:hypothetical protein